MSVLGKINASLDRYSALNPGVEPRVVVMDDESYFELKLEEYGEVDVAISLELETILGLRVFYNRLGYTYIDVV